MPKPPLPPDLKNCPDCRKVIGPHKGWFGPECQCGKPVGDALRGAHGAGTRRSPCPYQSFLISSSSSGRSCSLSRVARWEDS